MTEYTDFVEALITKQNKPNQVEGFAAMTTEKIGRVKTGSGKTWVVAWNSTSGEVYCGPSGATFRVGKAKSIGEAMKLAEAYCYNK